MLILQFDVILLSIDTITLFERTESERKENTYKNIFSFYLVEEKKNLKKS